MFPSGRRNLNLAIFLSCISQGKMSESPPPTHKNIEPLTKMTGGTFFAKPEVKANTQVNRSRPVLH